jgi:hypothetical protein
VSAGHGHLVSSGVTEISDDDPGFDKGFLGRDPDDHALLLVERPKVVR